MPILSSAVQVFFGGSPCSVDLVVLLIVVFSLFTRGSHLRASVSSGVDWDIHLDVVSTDHEDFGVEIDNGKVFLKEVDADDGIVRGSLSDDHVDADGEPSELDGDILDDSKDCCFVSISHYDVLIS